MSKNVSSPVTQNSAAAMSGYGNRAFDRMDKISAEFFAISYGSFVRQLFVDTNDNVEAVNAELEKVGVRIGMRLIDEYIAKSGAPSCKTFVQTGEAIAYVALRMFLGINAALDNVVPADSYSIVFDENPLNLFVELPEQYRSKLWYSNILCGVIRGALDQINFACEVSYVKDMLRGDSRNEIRVKFKALIKDQFRAQD